MAFELYAHAAIPERSDPVDSVMPARGVPHMGDRHYRILVGTYATKLLAQWWGINIQRVYIDPPENTKLATQRSIYMYEIVEVP